MRRPAPGIHARGGVEKKGGVSQPKGVATLLYGSRDPLVQLPGGERGGRSVRRGGRGLPRIGRPVEPLTPSPHGLTTHARVVKLARARTPPARDEGVEGGEAWGLWGPADGLGGEGSKVRNGELRVFYHVHFHFL